jgi:hypothetical protein
VRTVPKISPMAHLFATFKYDGKDPLLPGSVSLFRDGAFIGTSNMALLRPKEERAMGFGVDDKVSVDYWLEDGGQSTEGVFTSNRRIERKYRIEIDNYRNRSRSLCSTSCRCRRMSASSGIAAQHHGADQEELGRSPGRAAWPASSSRTTQGDHLRMR